MEKKLELFDKKVKKESNKKQVSFRFCPACGSVNLKPQIYGMGKDAVALSPMMRCTDCGFYGFVFDGTPEFLKEFREKLKKNSSA
ncbi:MAG: hypothetical protein ABH986_02045 [archaeon]